MGAYKKAILSLDTLRKLASNFLQAFGLLAMLLGVAAAFWPTEVGRFGGNGFCLMIIVSVAYALFASWPRFSHSRTFKVPDMKVSVKIGDLLKEHGNVVIGMNDVFDTEIGRGIIARSSLQGQFLERIYQNDRGKLDSDLQLSLSSQPLATTKDAAKTVGKDERFPLGTVAVLDHEGSKYFCVAYSNMGTNLMATSDIGTIWSSLEKLWQAIRSHGEQARVVMPVIGADLSRVVGVSHDMLIELIISSFVINSRIQPITKEFTLVIHPSNLSKINFAEIRKFVDGL